MTSVSSSMAEAGPSGAVRKRAFARAKRHSRFVRFYKLAIPIGSLLAVTGVGAVAYLDPFRAVRGLTLGPMSVSGTQVTMESPKLTGYRNDSRPYEVTARRRFRTFGRPNLVELKTMKARIVTDDQGSAAHLVANVGVLDTQKERWNCAATFGCGRTTDRKRSSAPRFVEFQGRHSGLQRARHGAARQRRDRGRRPRGDGQRQAAPFPRPRAHGLRESRRTRPGRASRFPRPPTPCPRNRQASAMMIRSRFLLPSWLGFAGRRCRPSPRTRRGIAASAFGGLGTNKEPIKIDADRLDVFDKESRAVFAGNVVAVQGESTMKCTTLTVFYEQARNQAAAKPAARPPRPAGRIRQRDQEDRLQGPGHDRLEDPGRDRRQRHLRPRSPTGSFSSATPPSATGRTSLAASGSSTTSIAASPMWKPHQAGA